MPRAKRVARRTGAKRAPPPAKVRIETIEDVPERIHPVRADRPREVYAEIMLTNREASLIRALLYSGLWGMTEGEVVERLVAEGLRRHFRGVDR